MDLTIDCDELYGLLEDDELVVVDCRSEEDWAHRPLHIPGALRMSIMDLHRAAHVLPDDELIVLCGAEPDGSDSQRARRLLKQRGRDAVCLAGGLEAWLRAGLPIERHAARQEQLAQASMGR
jgi:rhodanese-related sulfurtransferase